jgi:hypothetical protein
MTKLDKVGIRVSLLSGKVYIARFGKDPQLALETRECLNEFLHAIKEFVGVDSERDFGDDDEWYCISLRKIERPNDALQGDGPGGEAA